MKQASEWKKRYRRHRDDPAYHYDGPLGMSCGPEGSRLYVWSPVARSMTLRLYRDGARGEAFRTVPMEKAGGVFSFSTEEDLSGTYYDLEALVDGERQVCVDPYAKACGINSGRGAFLDLRQTDPPGFSDDRPPAREAEDVIYEVHVKEFSWDPSGGFPKGAAGTYGAFAVGGTHLPDHPEIPTGLGHIKRLGATHVQLMPVYDFGSVDEGGPRDAFNWGYDPVLWNVPEGSYSSDPADCAVRIRELKEAVMAIHRAGLRVVMDVVFNHTFSMDTGMQKLMPWYYYRKSNGSGCGNDIASEEPMCGRLILDSVLYWASEYHIDGFRFDLMGLLDVPLMNRIRAALDERFGRGEKLLYGEPWAAGRTNARRGTVLADKGNLSLLDPLTGAFCDGLRDAVKGSVFDRSDPGYIGGNYSVLERLKRGIAGDVIPVGGCAKAPSQAIIYVSAHDNHSLWDKVSLRSRDEAQTRRRCRMAAAICLMSQGRPFLLSGEEFGRTKDGIENAFCSPISVNRLDWTGLERERDLAEYYRGLIGLRKKVPALIDKSEAAYRRLSFLSLEEPLLGWCYDNGEDPAPWEKVLVIANPLEEEREIPLPALGEGTGGWRILADADRSDWWTGEEAPPLGDACRVPGCAVCVLGFGGMGEN